MGNRSLRCFTCALDADEEKADLREANKHLLSENEDLKQKLTAQEQRRKAEKKQDTGKDVKEPNWLNNILDELWPKISEFAEKTVKEKVEPLIQAALPSPLQGAFSFKEVSLGDKALHFNSIDAKSIDYDTRFGSKRDIQVSINTLFSGHSCIRVSAAGAKLGIQDIHFSGTITIVLKNLIAEPPFFEGLSVFFVNPPVLKMAWNGAIGVLNLLKDVVHNIASQQINNICVLPKRVAVVLNEEAQEHFFRLKSPMPPGCLHLRVLRARNLEGKDWSLFHSRRTSDPYAIVRIGGLEHRTQTVSTTCHPHWDERVTFPVYHKEQFLHVGVWDEDNKLKQDTVGDDFLGHVHLTVDDILEFCSSGAPVWLSLGPDEDMDVKTHVQGQVEVMATWMPVQLDQETANEIEAPDFWPQALLQIGIYSMVVPHSTCGTEYTIKVSCNGKTEEVRKPSKAPIQKYQKLLLADLDMQSLVTVVEVEEPFMFSIDVPKLTVVEIEVLKGSDRVGSLTYNVADCLKCGRCTQHEAFKSGDIKIDLLAQVRTISNPEGTIDEQYVRQKVPMNKRIWGA